MDKFDIAERLKVLRKLLDVTQEEFAEHAGMSYKFYQHIESGRKKLIRIDTIERLANAYNMPLHEFFAPHPPKSVSVKALKSAKPHSRK